MVSSFKVVIVCIVSLIVFIFLEQALKNRSLMAEVSFLKQAYAIWEIDPEGFGERAEEVEISRRRGFPVPSSNQEWEEQLDREVAMSWTNSVLGKGRLVLLVGDEVVWVDSEGEVWNLDVPRKAVVSPKWYFKDPVVGGGRMRKR